MLALVSFAAAGFAPLGLMPQSRARAVVMAADDNSLLHAMSDSFFANKRAKLESELASRLAELEEYEARERALVDSAGSLSAATSTAAPADLLAELAAEKAKSAALEAALNQAQIDNEIALQKVAAFWIGKVEEAKSAPALAAAPAAAAPLAAAAAPAAAADLVPTPSVMDEIDPDLSLKELRARLLSAGLATTGLKTELRKRLAGAMETSRMQYKSWDPATLSWV